MFSDSYVRPPLVAREATPPWVALWRFRLVILLVLGALVLIGFLAFRQLSGANAQDPGVGAAGPVSVRLA